MMERDLDLAMKLAKAINLLIRHPKASADMKVFLVLDQCKPFEFSVEDLEKITGLQRKAVGDVLNMLGDWGYTTDKVGKISRSQ